MSEVQELSGQELLDSEDVGEKTLLVSLDKWLPGKSVRVKRMTAEELDAYEKSLIKITVTGNKVIQEPDISNRTAKLLARCICDAQARRHYRDKDIEALGRKDGPMMKHIHDEASKFNGLDRTIEELAGNSNVIPPNDLPSD